MLFRDAQWCCRFQSRHVVAPRARKSSPCTLETPQNRRFYACWANFFAEVPVEGLCWASFFAPIGPAPRSCRRRGARGWLRWGFCSIRSWLAACRRRVVPLMTPFPPFGDGPAEPSAASARSMCGSPCNWTIGQLLLYSSVHADHCFASRRHEPARPGHGRPDALPYPDVPA